MARSDIPDWQRQAARRLRREMTDAEPGARRDAWMAREGYRVLRFWNNEVLGNLEGVLDRIGREIAAAPPLQLSPTRGERARVAPAAKVVSKPERAT